MGRELSEDRVHKLERQLALAKAYAEDMQAAFQECEDHATALDEEAEKIQEEVCSDFPRLRQILVRHVHQLDVVSFPILLCVCEMQHTQQHVNCALTK